ncbi:ABC transporter permease [Lactiplantibacillus pingfangensis]|uniref:ABC transporter permease n=1 Tax=Lactiplantibacillus pingfangensis TaxID=2559915 RepID=UPI0010F49DAA|nr:ABC transporter permease [Lactiplantibacillus pingfangensis]
MDSKFNFVSTSSATDTAEQPTTPVSIGFWQSAGHKFSHDRLSMTCATILIILVLVAIFGPMLSPLNPNQLHVNQQNLAPSQTYWFGTDHLGRDLFTRVCLGVRISLIVALVATLLSMVFGTIYGMLMSYFGGWVDSCLMRLIEIFNSLPSLLVTMIIMTVLGNGIGTMLFALAITSWAGAARQARGLVLQLRDTDYVTAAIMLNTPLWKIMLRHFVPNMMSILILDIGQSIPANIFAEASLSFLGLGIQAPNTSLGILISEGQNQMLQHASQLYIPILVLVVIVLAFNIVGDGLRDALDPKFKA